MNITYIYTPNVSFFFKVEYMLLKPKEEQGKLSALAPSYQQFEDLGKLFLPWLLVLMLPHCLLEDGLLIPN